jgi:hypothetical protein
MTSALIVFLNVFFIAFVLVAVLGLLAWGIVSDRSITSSIADQRVRRRTASPRRAPRETSPAQRSPARRRPRRALDLGG